jgi:hypothetical protein
MPTIRRGASPFLALVALLTVMMLAACSAAAAPSPSPQPSAPPSAGPIASEPRASADPGSVGGGGGTSGDPGTGIGGPAGPTPVDPGAGQPALVIPKPGQLDPHPVSPQQLQASVDGRHVLVKVTWTSGVEPCYVLDSVKVQRSGMTIALTVFEGSSDPNAMCIEIATVKATIVDLGELEPGAWTITAPDSEAAPITLTIS